MRRVTLLQLPSSIQDELLRLHKAEAAAWMAGDISVAVHSRLLWAELYITAGGIASPGVPALVARVAGLGKYGNAIATLWRQRLRCRPLVAVVRRVRVPWRDDSGRVFHNFTERLACGHTLTTW